jgi:two-component sensor histidine kinase
MIVVIRDITERKKEQEQLMLSQANLRATINNTEVLIWSVDRNFRLMTFNKPFAAYIKKQYNIDIAPGSTIFKASGHAQEEEMVRKWSEIYMRVLAGEVITMEESRFGIDFQYSLSPIIEGDLIVGVSIFADNITERKAHDRELAEANKKVGELKLMALRSAMSPHFVFNVLNSIQFFIAKNDRLNAINYLSTFSKLIRSILNHSVNNKIKLADEIEMLKNYVQLEMTRFENKFNFILDVNPEVDVDAIEIPSLLIQPYVENAILHGLYKKQEQGTLQIRINEHDGALVFEIEDDGIGREAAIKLKKENFPSHKSMGIKLTEERLRLINEYHRAAFQIEDLFNEKGPCGTRVRISVPV